MTPAEMSCPECGGDDLSGSRDGEAIRITCASCGHTWARDLTPRCGYCGSDRVAYAPRPLWEKGRGGQYTPAGRIDSYTCADCGRHDVTSSRVRGE